MSAPAKCGWCITDMHDRCKPLGDGWSCHCTHKGETHDD